MATAAYSLAKPMASRKRGPGISVDVDTRQNVVRRIGGEKHLLAAFLLQKLQCLAHERPADPRRWWLGTTKKRNPAIVWLQIGTGHGHQAPHGIDTPHKLIPIEGEP